MKWLLSPLGCWLASSSTLGIDQPPLRRTQTIRAETRRSFRRNRTKGIGLVSGSVSSPPGPRRSDAQVQPLPVFYAGKASSQHHHGFTIPFSHAAKQCDTRSLFFASSTSLRSSFPSSAESNFPFALYLLVIDRPPTLLFYFVQTALNQAMKIALSTSLLLACAASSGSAFLATPPPPSFSTATATSSTSTSIKGYLDDLSEELHRQADEPDNPLATRDDTKAKQTDRGGVASWDDYVEFEEFDGGDGQMGVAGDGKKGLEKEWDGAAQMAKSKFRSAKNAWGTTTGYAEELVKQGVDISRAQQLENWHNQQEVLKSRQQQRYMTEDFDKVSEDTSWRDLSSFGVERTQVRTRLCTVDRDDCWLASHLRRFNSAHLYFHFYIYCCLNRSGFRLRQGIWARRTRPNNRRYDRIVR